MKKMKKQMHRKTWTWMLM